MAAGGDKIGQVSGHVPEAVAMLPEAVPESSAPGGVGVKPLHMLVVEPVEPLPGGDALGNKDEVEAVHQPPVFVKIAGFAADTFVPDRRAIQRAELGHVHFIEIERENEVAGGFHCLRRFPRQAEDE